MRSVLFLIVLWFAVADAQAEPPKILVVGDSLSAAYGMDTARAWPQLLQRRLQAEGYPHQVVNISVSGETTQGGLARLPAGLAQTRPQIVIVQLGGNDGLRGLPPEAMHANLARLIAVSRAAGAQVLLVGIRLPPNYGMRYTQRFHQVYLDLAEEAEVPLVPFMLKDVAERREMMQADGIHPTPEAQPRVLENVWPHLQPLLAQTRDGSARTWSPLFYPSLVALRR